MIWQRSGVFVRDVGPKNTWIEKYSWFRVQKTALMQHQAHGKRFFPSHYPLRYGQVWYLA